jgi:hypothetical protein
MDAMADYEAPGDFYRAEEGGEMIPWRRNGPRRMQFFNGPILGRRGEEATPISEGERSMRGGSCFPHGGAIGGCSGAVVCGG